MTLNLLYTIEELVEERPWNKFIVYHLTKTQREEIFDYQGLIKKRHEADKGYEYEEHKHDEPQLLLVEKGKLIHRVNSKEYVQGPGDLLVIPKNIQHTGYVEEDLVVYVFHKK